MRKYSFSVAIIRGAHLNPYEMQNYSPLVKSVKIRTFSSLRPLGISNKISNTKLPSLTDFAKILPHSLPSYFEKIVRYITNRTIGDQHFLLGLEKQLTEYDILHTADPYYYFSYQAAKAKQLKQKLVCTVWETKPHNNEKTRIKRRIKQYVINKTDLFICHTEKARQAVIKDGAAKDKTVLLKLGIDTKVFKPFKNRQANLLFVGRLVKEKGVLVLIDAFIRLTQELPKLSLTVIGKGELKAVLLAKIKKHGLQKKVKLINVPYTKISKYYQSANIFIFPSLTTPTWEEQYGMALLEAMASGLAIITTKSGAIAEIVGKQAIFVPENKVSILAQKIKLLVNNQRLISKYAVKARANAVQYYSSQKYAQIILKTYEKLLCRNIN